jgi:hypothetical protein
MIAPGDLLNINEGQRTAIHDSLIFSHLLKQKAAKFSGFFVLKSGEADGT